MNQNFNPEQQAAIMHSKGPALVIAGPGSGKTHVFTGRISYLVRHMHADPGTILALSFTKKAADSMKKRYLLLTGEEDSGVVFGTFHSVFMRLLNEYLPELSLKPQDDGTALNILRNLSGLSTDRASLLLNDISKVKNLALKKESLPAGILKSYQEALHRMGFMDYDDILILTYKLLCADPLILCDIRRRFKYILIDEFQDINRLQFKIILLISAPSYNIFAVGDEDQSIYGFRGSDPGIMLKFKKLFSDAGLYALKHNYRSKGNISIAAQKLIKHNKHRYHKRPLINKDRGNGIDIRSFRNARDEAQAVINEVIGLDKEVTVAILFRTYRAGSYIAALLSDTGILSNHHIELMTFHSSKGLEFDEVFIIHANQEITPGRGEIEEERRLFYVAVTRAKHRLHIFDTKYGYNSPQTRSRFVRELA